MKRLLPLLLVFAAAFAGGGCAGPIQTDCWHGVIAEARELRVHGAIGDGQWERMKDLHGSADAGRCEEGREIVRTAVPQPRPSRPARTARGVERTGCRGSI